MKANAKSKADPKAAAAEASRAPNKKLILLVAVATLVVGAGAGGAWYFMHGKSDAVEHKAVKVEPPEYVAVEPFTVNLQPEEGEQYLQVQFTLQVANLQQVELMKANMAKVRSRVLLLLSGKKASEISTVEGKQQLAKEIIAALKQPFVDKGEPQLVTDVLYTSFIIQ